ncbi:MAG: hypothetical protein KKC03_06590 [Bacteroidetes bacterium]|nr:hypothetical protein [Bacteroidota bacterium]
MSALTLDRQSLLDIAIKETGSITSIFDFAIINGVGITDDIVPGSAIEIPTIDYGFKGVVDYYKTNRIFPATDIDEATLPARDEGIGFWQIGLTFKVS